MKLADMWRLRALRIALATIVILDLLSFSFLLAELRASDHNFLFNNSFLDSIAGVLIVGAGIAGAVWFASKPGRLLAGIVALVALAILSTAHAHLYGSPWRHLFYSGLCLFGWSVGLAFSRARGSPSDESYAAMGSIALLGTAYLNAGISKLIYGGMDWLSGAPIQAVIIGQDGLAGAGVLKWYRSWIVGTPAVAAALSIATLVFELAAPLMIFGGRIRRLLAVGLFAMHLNIYVLTRILYWQSMILLLLFGFSSENGNEREEMLRPGLRPRLFLPFAALLAIAAALAVSHQAERHHAPSGVPTPQGGPPAVTVAVLEHVGPLSRGQKLSEEWSVESLRLTDNGFIVNVSGKNSAFGWFEVSCVSPDPSRFQVGRAKIFYSSSLEYAADAALALAAVLKQAAANDDPCERMSQWRQNAADG